MKRYFKDFYGCTASIHTKQSNPNYAELIIRNPMGKIVTKKVYKSYKGARIAMGKASEVWNEV